MTEIERIENLFNGTDTEFVTINRDQWQTLKADVLAQRTNNTGDPKLPAFEVFEAWVHQHGGMDNRNTYNWFIRNFGQVPEI